MGKSKIIDPAEITDENRPFVIEWLNDRSAFHTWFSTLVTGSFVLISLFGKKPNFTEPGGVVLFISLGLLALSLVANLVCVWSIPSWKYRVSANTINNALGMRRELAITAWFGVICFICGISFGFIGNT
ncbi:MAG: hypothetical protein OEY38_23200 [Gammaproteobacteria bacterium]|nr:hypothetical protein [Gammaproteobacteria bacterium]